MLYGEEPLNPRINLRENDDRCTATVGLMVLQQFGLMQYNSWTDAVPQFVLFGCSPIFL